VPCCTVNIAHHPGEQHSTHRRPPRIRQVALGCWVTQGGVPAPESTQRYQRTVLLLGYGMPWNRPSRSCCPQQIHAMAKLPSHVMQLV
jgi:hypothetical protein